MCIETGSLYFEMVYRTEIIFYIRETKIFDTNVCIQKIKLQVDVIRDLCYPFFSNPISRPIPPPPRILSSPLLWD